jgi:NADPH-dependent 2,4-dienoyl-CoA reductase/sulfur reductase-like enzyme
VTLVGDENTAPYERPALSKQFLAGTRSRIELRPPEYWEEREIQLVLGHRVRDINLVMGQIPGAPPADAIVLATGARPRSLPCDVPVGVHTLRTVADAEALREALRPGRRLAVIGAGFLGAEVASTARSLDVEVTMIEPERAPLARILGDEVGGLLAERHRAHGIDLHLGVGAAGFLTSEAGTVRGVELTDGRTVACDTALVAVGAMPECSMLGDVGEGIRTDACGRTEYAGVYACGDVSCAWRPSVRRHVRVEHWTSAAGEAAAVAHAILGEERPYDDVPYFWSDQVGLRLQYVGHTADQPTIDLTGDPDSFIARYSDRDGRLVAALAANSPKAIGALRRSLAGEVTAAAA